MQACEDTGEALWVWVNSTSRDLLKKQQKIHNVTTAVMASEFGVGVQATRTHNRGHYPDPKPKPEAETSPG